MEHLHIFVTRDIPNEFSKQVISFAERSQGYWSFFASGGSLAPRLYRALATQSAFHSLAANVSIYMGDERVVEPTGNDSNTSNVKKFLTEPLASHGIVSQLIQPFTTPQYHALSSHFSGMPGSDYKLCDSIAAEYDAKIRVAPKPWLVHLGIGPDGHTASLFADSPALSEPPNQRIFLANYDPAGKNPHCRLTLSLGGISQAALVIITTSGKDKAAAVRGLLEGDQSLPVSQVRAGQVNLILDYEAASLVDK